MSDVQLVQEWDSDRFHRRVAELEAQGYIARKESYQILAEVDPETGAVSHLHSIEMHKADAQES